MLVCGDPFFIVFLYEFRKSRIGFGFLHSQQITHITVGLFEFELPKY